MINLLSPSAKKKLWNEYRIRLSIIVLVAIAFLELFAAALFSPALFSIRRSTAGLSAYIEKGRTATESNKSVSAELGALKGDLAMLKIGEKGIDAPPSSLLASIVAVKPRGVLINNLAYVRNGEVVSVQLSGVAERRDDILAFKNELDKDKRFTVTRTGDYLIKKTNISFSVTLTMK